MPEAILVRTGLTQFLNVETNAPKQSLSLWIFSASILVACFNAGIDPVFLPDYVVEEG